MLTIWMELPFADITRVITKGFLNPAKQDRPLLTVEEVVPNQWMELSFEFATNNLQTEKGRPNCVCPHTTDFEHTVRDKTDYHLSVDMEHSSLFKS